MDHSNMAGMDHSSINMSNTAPPVSASTQTSDSNIVDGKNLTLVATESSLEVKPGTTLPVWTFNNSVPGPQIRVKVGETVRVTLKNELPEPVSIHWHGYPVPNAMDGIPGVTQDAVVPGKTFTYEFKATVPGTYWYHSHQDSVNQLDRGLYGSLIVEDPKEQYDRDYTLVLDEWMSMGLMDMSNMGNMNGMDHSSMPGMDHGNMNSNHGTNTSSDSPAAGSHDMSMYDIYTINGKTGDAINSLPVKKGDKVRLRFINAGYLTHKLHIHGHDYRIIATDGQPVNSPALISNQLIAIAPGERYDIEFTADNPGKWLIEEHGDEDRMKNMRTVIAYEGSNSSVTSDWKEDQPLFDLTKYGAATNMKFTLNQPYDHEETLNLNTSVLNGETVYTINDKVFPNTDKIHVQKGDIVKVKFINKSPKDDHPMHLHGHFFQILSKNGKPIEGSPIIKDTLNVKPGEEYVVAFEADNPGDWMFHCHDLHHASAGMVTDVHYSDYNSNYTPDPTVGNKPE
ncbi:multicopper oxidase family protein [Paenibacillus albiflavus]|uniref:Multicopper oxidase family protein n=2 Tax=Paenibacillus albiflavus TaxID=2545760 RepID=A0A4R4EKF4_9BACL|nr:multicopper oxidase family protein [Paenibacillus albiflavus]